LIDETTLRSAQRIPTIRVRATCSSSLSQSCIPSRLHGLFGLIVIFSSPIVFTLLSRSLIHNERWSEVQHLLKWATILAWLGLLLFYGSIVIFLWIGASIQYHCGRLDK
jgi:hypothetical protein